MILQCGRNKTSAAKLNPEMLVYRAMIIVLVHGI
jgi:hypothetical protein